MAESGNSGSTPNLVKASCQPPNNGLLRTVMDEVPRRIRQRAAAELRR